MTAFKRNVNCILVITFALLAGEVAAKIYKGTEASGKGDEKTPQQARDAGEDCCGEASDRCCLDEVNIRDVWEGTVGKTPVRFFIKKKAVQFRGEVREHDSRFWFDRTDSLQGSIPALKSALAGGEFGGETDGLMYFTPEMVLTRFIYNPEDSTITEIVMDYPVVTAGGVWKCRVFQEETIKGKLIRQLSYDKDGAGKPGTAFTLVRHRFADPEDFSAICDYFYNPVDAALIIKEEGIESFGGPLRLFTRFNVTNSRLHYSGIRITSPIPRLAEVNALLRSLLPLDDDQQSEMFGKRREACFNDDAPSDPDEQKILDIIGWGDKYLTIMMAYGDIRIRQFSEAVIDLQKAELVDPSAWFADSLRCLAMNCGDADANVFNGADCEAVNRAFFARLAKTGKTKLGLSKDGTRFEIDGEEISPDFSMMLVEPSGDGMVFHVLQSNVDYDFYKINLFYDDAKNYLSPAGLKALKPVE